MYNVGEPHLERGNNDDRDEIARIVLRFIKIPSGILEQLICMWQKPAAKYIDTAFARDGDHKNTLPIHSSYHVR